MRPHPFLFVPLIVLLLEQSMANPVPTPMFEVPFKATVGVDSSLLYFGILPAASRCMVPQDCFNSHCEFELPPIPPAGVLNARFLPPPSCAGAGSWCDFRPFISRVQRDTFTFNAQLGGETAITLSWPAGLAARFEELNLEYSGGTPLNIDMLNDTSVTINAVNSVTVRILSNSLVVVDVEEDFRAGMPDMPDLFQNYPNPFNPSTNFKFTIVNRALTILKVYDLLGREVATLVNEVKEPGTYEATWDATGMASGVYLYRLSVGRYTQTRKLIVVK